MEIYAFYLFFIHSKIKSVNKAKMYNNSTLNTNSEFCKLRRMPYYNKLVFTVITLLLKTIH